MSAQIIDLAKYRRAKAQSMPAVDPMAGPTIFFLFAMASLAAWTTWHFK